MSRCPRWLLVALKAAVWLALCALPLAALVLVMPGPGGWMLAVAAMVAMVVVAVRLYQRWSGTTATPGVSALSFGLVANGIAVGLTMVSFLSAPTGGSGRPMGLTAFYFLFTLVMTPLGIGKAVRAWSQEKSLAISAMILSLGILPIALLTFFALAAAKAFELEP